MSSIVWLRISRLGYIGVSTPVLAQVKRLVSASALRAMWVTHVSPGPAGQQRGAAGLLVGEGGDASLHGMGRLDDVFDKASGVGGHATNLPRRADPRQVSRAP